MLGFGLGWAATTTVTMNPLFMIWSKFAYAAVTHLRVVTIYTHAVPFMPGSAIAKCLVRNRGKGNIIEYKIISFMHVFQLNIAFWNGYEILIYLHGFIEETNLWLIDFFVIQKCCAQRLLLTMRSDIILESMHSGCSTFGTTLPIARSTKINLKLYARLIFQFLNQHFTLDQQSNLVLVHYM